MDTMIARDGSFSIPTVLTPLRAAQPVLNGAPLAKAQAEVLQDRADWRQVRWTAPALGSGAFTLEARSSGDQIVLRYWVERLPLNTPLRAFGIRFAAVDNLRQYLCNGYYSWDGSYYVQPEGLADFGPDEPRPEIGYAMTQLLPRQGEGSVVLGFDRHDRFQHTFTFDTRRTPPALTIETLWDEKTRDHLDRCESERLFIFERPEVEGALHRWAEIVSDNAPTPPRRSSPPITGWCSWYNLYAAITEDNLLHHLHTAAEVARREHLDLRVFQIDDGFTPEMGDWLEVKPQFPRGIAPLLDDIRRLGFIPGLWIAPFMVGNRSRLYAEHPDWVVQDRQTGGPLVQMHFYGEFRWHKRSEEYYILDATHPEALDYLRRVFRTWRWEWGCEYFKTDFMHFGAAHGPERAVHHTPGLTRLEIWRRVAALIREEIGEALWLGCGFPLWAAVGLVDAVRIGRDVGVEWKGEQSAQSLLRDQATRNFANHVLWQADPDCVLLRSRFHHLSDMEVRSLALYAGMAGGVLTTSDDLSELPPERLALLKLILPAGQQACSFPYLGASEITYLRSPDGRRRPQALDPVLVQVRSLENGVQAVLIFNPSETTVQRAYPVSDFRDGEQAFVYDGLDFDPNSPAAATISVTLAPHASRLLFLADASLAVAPTSLGSSS